MIEPLLSDDAFIDDVRSAASDPQRLHLWWLGQSGYLVQWRDFHVLIDPYLSDSLTAKYAGTDKPHVRMSRRVIDPKRLDFIDLVTSSHGHTDHLDSLTLVRLHAVNGYLRLLAPRAELRDAEQRFAGELDYPVEIGDTVEMSGCHITAVAASHGDKQALGYVFRFGGITLYHSGDTTRFDAGVRDVDVAILPINGKLNNMDGRDAAQLAKQIGAKLVIPCHYDLFEFNTADPRDLFIPECEKLGQPYRVLQLGERLTLGPK